VRNVGIERLHGRRIERIRRQALDTLKARKIKRRGSEKIAPKAEANRTGLAVRMGKRSPRHGIMHVAIIFGEKEVEAEPREYQDEKESRGLFHASVIKGGIIARRRNAVNDPAGSAAAIV
jgi:hypothetical protein